MRPLLTAFLANSPAPSITDGLLVLVQLVIADITTDPEEREGRERAGSGGGVRGE